jgi:hypothetical protein
LQEKLVNAIECKAVLQLVLIGKDAGNTFILIFCSCVGGFMKQKETKGLMVYRYVGGLRRKRRKEPENGRIIPQMCVSRVFGGGHCACFLAILYTAPRKGER